LENCSGGKKGAKGKGTIGENGSDCPKTAFWLRKPNRKDELGGEDTEEKVRGTIKLRTLG